MTYHCPQWRWSQINIDLRQDNIKHRFSFQLVIEREDDKDVNMINKNY